MMTTSMERMLAKYTAHVEPVKVWKVTTTSGNCRNCIFNQRSHDEDGVVGYKCNKRNLTANGWKLDELFTAQNFEDWRCDTDTSFSYKPGKLKIKREKKENGMTPMQEARKARNEEVIAKFADGMSIEEIAADMSLKRSTVYKILKNKQ